MQIQTTYRQSGEPVQNLDLFTRAWDECIELQLSPRETWVGRALLALQALDRFEIAAFVDGEVVGGAVLAGDQWDAHVGECMSVFAQYVLPEFRGGRISPALMRESLRLARTTKATALAFTHRKGPWKYETIYRRIHEDPED